MKTLNIVLLAALFSVTFTSCSDNGPVSSNDRDANIVKSTVEEAVMGRSLFVPIAYTIPLKSSHEGAINSEFEVGECPVAPEGQEGWWGWHFLMPSNNNFTALTVTFKHAGTFTADPFPGDVFVAHPDNSHAYIWTPTDDILLSGSAESDGVNTFFNLSHVCPGDAGRSLDVSKTVVTTYTRTHEWDIEKKAETEYGYKLDGYPKVWLYIDRTGDEKATWTVDVTYEGYEDSGHNVSGVITIENIGTSTKSITSIVDELAGTPIDVDCGAGFELPYSLPVGETLTCTYSEDGKIEGNNVVTVTAEGEEDDPYVATKSIVWGDPTTEVNKTVNVKDISDLFGEVSLGSVTAPNDDTFTYDKDFAWADYGEDDCGSFMYDNTASIVETGQSDDASLKVNVQCYVYESAWAKGDNPDAADEVESFCDNGFNNWGWTNKIGTGSFEWDLWAGAGQCDTSKGTLVGTVVVDYNGGFNVQFNIDPDLILKETHVYAGTDMFPQGQGRRGGNTTAPGQYYIQDPLTGDIWVIAHGVVGLPDPDFGPAE
ncbi:MAG: hypothetical protein ACNA8K_12990 [Cyclonatronaceae bacterium]